MSNHTEPSLEKPTQVTLSRTLGPGSVVLLGIGAILGGGIFTLLGPAAGIAGPGLFLTMLLGSAVAFLNIQMYIALGTTFPMAGGSYSWIKKGLGNFQGFLAGWVSWFANAAACGVYALSFGFYAFNFLRILGIDINFSIQVVEKIFALFIIILFGYFNWRGAKTTSRMGNIITFVLLIILVTFIIFGFSKIFSSPQPTQNFHPLLPMGLFGIVAAASFFYIAFEGAEIQAQTGEETKNPKRDIKIGLFGSWAVVSLLYLLISFVLVGTAPTDQGTVWSLLGGWGESAMTKSAQIFMPFGAIVITIGGLLANIAALNATIYSSSHISFALARDKNIWSRLANIHLKNATPHLAVIASVILVALMVIFLPLFSVAAIASLLFVLLFMQLNIAGIKIHFKFPQTKWQYKIPFFPITPLVAIVIYILLALTMLKISPLAWFIAIFWIILGLLNYSAYSQKQSREDFAKEVAYEEVVHVSPKAGRRILLPISSKIDKEELKNLTQIAFALASQWDGEVVVVRIHEVDQPREFIHNATLLHEQQRLKLIKEWVEEFNREMPGLERDINFHSFILVGRDTVEIILDVIKAQECDFIILNWEGYTQTQGVIFGGKIDRLLRESKCDMLVLKNARPPTSILLNVNPNQTSPYLDLIGKVALAMHQHFKTEIKLLGVLESETLPEGQLDSEDIFRNLGIPRNVFSQINFVKKKSVIMTIIEQSKAMKSDLVIVGSSGQKFLKEIRFGNISEFLAKHLPVSLMIVRGHEGIAETFWKKILYKFR